MTTARKTTRHLRIANTRSVLEIIHRDGPISAARLSDRCALRPSTISNILKDATARGAVRSCGHGESTRQGGKRPLLLELDPNYGWLVGVEIGRKGLKLSIRDFSLAEKYRREIPNSDEHAATMLADLVSELDKFRAREVGEIRGIGIAASAVDEKALAETLSTLRTQFACPVQLDRPAALAACGEWLLKRQRGPEGLVWLGLEADGQGWTAETGVVLDGRLRPGSGVADMALAATGGDVGDVLRLVAGLLDPELIVLQGGPAEIKDDLNGLVHRPGFGAFAVAEGGVALAFEEALEQVG